MKSSGEELELYERVDMDAEAWRGTRQCGHGQWFYAVTMT